MRVKKIIPVEWLDMKPYDNSDSVDLYYVGLVNNGSVPYRVACILHGQGLIPDAAINNLKGYEYGRDFLHKNGDSFLSAKSFS